MTKKNIPATHPLLIGIAGIVAEAPDAAGGATGVVAGGAVDKV